MSKTDQQPTIVPSNGGTPAVDSSSSFHHLGQSHPPANVKTGLAQMLKGGVIMDVMNVEQAKIAEEAGAVAVMALGECASSSKRASACE